MRWYRGNTLRKLYLYHLDPIRLTSVDVANNCQGHCYLHISITIFGCGGTIPKKSWQQTLPFKYAIENQRFDEFGQSLSITHVQRISIILACTWRSHNLRTRTFNNLSISTAWDSDSMTHAFWMPSYVWIIHTISLQLWWLTSGFSWVLLKQLP